VSGSNIHFVVPVGVWFKYSFHSPEVVIFIYIMFAEKQTISRNIKLDKTLSVIRLANPFFP